MYHLVILLTLQMITTSNSRVMCGPNGCCFYKKGTGGFVVNCTEYPNFHDDLYIECRDDRMSVFCTPKNASNWIRGGLIANKRNCVIERLDFHNCRYPRKPFYDTIRTFSKGTNIKTVSFSSEEVKQSYIMSYNLLEFPNLITLILNHAGFQWFYYDTLRSVPKLENLDLSNNSITEIKLRIFEPTTKLKRLDLSFNELSYVNLSLFRDVPDLRSLSLESNRLKDLDDMFVGLIRLEDLNIDKNKLTTLPARLFETLRSLRRLNMSENEFSSLPRDLLAKNSDLEECYLSNNRGSLTSLPKAMFGNLSYLRILRLGGNKLVELSENSFWGSYSLTQLDLSGNALAKLPENIFRDSRNLVTLNLNRNVMDSLPDRLFGSQMRLAHLYLGQNRLTTISRSIFSRLTSLIELDLSSNRIHHLEADCFRVLFNLRILRLSKNSIESPIQGFEVTSLFLNCKNLDALYLDHNKISMTDFRWMDQMDSLAILDMDSNFVSTLEFRYIHIILTNNNITTIPLPWTTERYDIGALTVVVSVGNNPLHCGCELYQLLELLDKNPDTTFYYGYRFVLDSLACKEPARMQGQQITKIYWKTFSCPDNSKDNFAYCVERCDCLWRPYDEAALIDCSRKFEGRLPDSFVGSRGKGIELNLTGNGLTKVPLSDTSVFKSIRKLFLSHNLISSISLIDIPSKIEVLHLDHNRLKAWDARILRDIEASRSLKELALGNNPWKCDRNTERSLAVIERKFEAPVAYTSDSHCIDGRHITQAKKLPRLYITYARF